MFVLRLGSPCESVLGWWLQSSKEADPQRLGRSSEVAAPCFDLLIGAKNTLDVGKVRRSEILEIRSPLWLGKRIYKFGFEKDGLLPLSI